ncbi:MAG: hypothetical protein ACLQA5_14100 [Solirubrobacteraceae bacterium]
MSYSGLATAAVVLAVLAAAVAVTAGILLCVGRRRLAEKTLPVFLGVLACVIVVTFAAVATSESDLRTHTQRTLALASAAERTELSRTGRYTVSVLRLERLNRAFAVDVKVNEPIVRVTSGPGRRAVTLWVSAGPGTHAQATLGADGRLEPVSERGARAPSRRRLVLATSGRRLS